MHNFKNDRQMEISTFARFFIKMLNYSILDHINDYALYLIWIHFLTSSKRIHPDIYIAYTSQ